MQYRTCPYCGANLDPCERCDCQDEKKEAAPAASETTSGIDTHRQFISACPGSQEPRGCQNAG